MNETGTGALFREKSAWATAAVIGIVNGGALVAIWAMPQNPMLWVGVMVPAVITQIIVLLALHIIIALGTPKQPDDERDAVIRGRSTRYSVIVDTIGIWFAIIALISQRAAMGDDGPSNLLLDPMLVAYGLFLCVVVAEVIRLLTQAMDYRRSQ